MVVVGYPNYLGCLEDLADARALCDRTGALLVVGSDPVCGGLLRSPGEWGADVVVGEGQAFGTPLELRRSLPRAVRLRLEPTSGGCPDAWWARPSTPRAGGPT